MKLSVQDLAMFIGCYIHNTEPLGYEDKIGQSRELTVGLLSSLNTWNMLDRVKPILRPLSDMTEKEMKELYSLVFKRPFVGNNITHRDIGKELERYVLWSGIERLFIYSNGDIGADCDLSYYPVHQPTVVKWLISKQFDVFGWIQKGLALSTNLN